MKLQKQSVGKIGDREYHKYVIIVPNEDIEKAGFKEGEELVAESKKGEIKLKRR